jgi:nitronate monooxygenase
VPKGDVKTMNFETAGGSKAKAWRDIWGSGQGIGAIKTIGPAAAFIDKLKAEYEAGKRRLSA